MDTPAYVAVFRRLLALVESDACQMIDRPFQIQSDIYCDPARLELERSRLFRRLPLVLGHTAMLPAVDDALTLDVLGVPEILARARDGVVRGFVNACRHRGAACSTRPSRCSARRSYVRTTTGHMASTARCATSPAPRASRAASWPTAASRRSPSLYLGGADLLEPPIPERGEDVEPQHAPVVVRRSWL